MNDPPHDSGSAPIEQLPGRKPKPVMPTYTQHLLAHPSTQLKRRPWVNTVQTDCIRQKKNKNEGQTKITTTNNPTTKL